MIPTVEELATRGRVHLVGVGGAGMSAVAALLVARGLEVSGSDSSQRGLGPVRAVGVNAYEGHLAAHVDGAGTVVVSSAIRPTNPELVRARELGIPVLHRSQALAALGNGRRTVAVAGAHGKTTTSAMVATVLAHAELDPSWAIGGNVRGASGDPVGGAHPGGGDVLVIEADESDGSFLAYTPQIAVVTNVEPDHLDHYGSVAAFEQAFIDFAARVSGTLVVCADDPGARRLAQSAPCPVRTYGRSDADVLVGEWVASGTGGRTTVTEPGGERIDLTLAVPGEHNALNAAAAWTVARLLGVDAHAAAAGLATFTGTGRRFELKGAVAGVEVYDDYAHHPTEVTALLRAARAVTRGRVLVLFQPHLFSRTKAFAQQFAQALDLADEAVVTDVYAAREDVDPAVTGELITARSAHGRFVPDMVDAAHVVAGLARPGDLVLTVGAGDVTMLGEVILADLEGR